MLALLAAAGEDGRGGDPVGQQRPGDIDALAARVDVRRRARMTCAPVQPLDLDRAVEARVEGQRDDHARITRRPGDLAHRTTRSSSSPVSVISRSISASTPNRRQVVVADLGVVGEHDGPPGGPIIARLTAASAGSGVVRPRSTEAVGADEGDVHVEVRERPQGPVVDRRQGLARGPGRRAAAP